MRRRTMAMMATRAFPSQRVQHALHGLLCTLASSPLPAPILRLMQEQHDALAAKGAVKAGGGGVAALLQPFVLTLRAEILSSPYLLHVLKTLRMVLRVLNEAEEREWREKEMEMEAQGSGEEDEAGEEQKEDALSEAQEAEAAAEEDKEWVAELVDALVHCKFVHTEAGVDRLVGLRVVEVCAEVARRIRMYIERQMRQEARRERDRKRRLYNRKRGRTSITSSRGSSSLGGTTAAVMEMRMVLWSLLQGCMARWHVETSETDMPAAGAWMLSGSNKAAGVNGNGGRGAGAAAAAAAAAAARASNGDAPAHVTANGARANGGSNTSSSDTNGSGTSSDGVVDGGGSGVGPTGAVLMDEVPTPETAASYASAAADAERMELVLHEIVHLAFISTGKDTLPEQPTGAGTGGPASAAPGSPLDDSGAMVATKVLAQLCSSVLPFTHTALQRQQQELQAQQAAQQQQQQQLQQQHHHRQSSLGQPPGGGGRGNGSGGKGSGKTADHVVDIRPLLLYLRLIETSITAADGRALHGFSAVPALAALMRDELSYVLLALILNPPHRYPADVLREILHIFELLWSSSCLPVSRVLVQTVFTHVYIAGVQQMDCILKNQPPMNATRRFSFLELDTIFQSLSNLLVSDSSTLATLFANFDVGLERYYGDEPAATSTDADDDYANENKDERAEPPVFRLHRSPQALLVSPPVVQPLLHALTSCATHTYHAPSRKLVLHLLAQMARRNSNQEQHHEEQDLAQGDGGRGQEGDGREADGVAATSRGGGGAEGQYMVYVQRVLATKAKRREGALLFNQKASHGIRFWQSCGVLVSNVLDPAALALVLRTEPALNKIAVGEYLGIKGNSPEDEQFHENLLAAYCDLFNFQQSPLLHCLRMFLSAFRLPREAQQIDRLLQAFANRVHTDCAEARAGMFATSDVTYLLTVSIIMLNTGLHNPNIAPNRRMKEDEFVRQNRDYGQDVSRGTKLPDEWLENVYQRIRSDPMEVDEIDYYGKITKDRWSDLVAQVALAPGRGLLWTCRTESHVLTALGRLFVDDVYSQAGRQSAQRLRSLSYDEQGPASSSSQADGDGDADAGEGKEGGLSLDTQGGDYPDQPVTASPAKSPRFSLRGLARSQSFHLSPWGTTHALFSDAVRSSIALAGQENVHDSTILAAHWREFLTVALSGFMETRFEPPPPEELGGGARHPTEHLSTVSATTAAANGGGDRGALETRGLLTADADHSPSGEALHSSVDVMLCLLNLCSNLDMQDVFDALIFLLCELTGLLDDQDGDTPSTPGRSHSASMASPRGAGGGRRSHESHHQGGAPIPVVVGSKSARAALGTLFVVARGMGHLFRGAWNPVISVICQLRDAHMLPHDVITLGMGMHETPVRAWTHMVHIVTVEEARALSFDETGVPQELVEASLHIVDTHSGMESDPVATWSAVSHDVEPPLPPQTPPVHASRHRVPAHGSPVTAAAEPATLASSASSAVSSSTSSSWLGFLWGPSTPFAPSDTSHHPHSGTGGGFPPPPGHPQRAQSAPVLAGMDNGSAQQQEWLPFAVPDVLLPIPLTHWTCGYTVDADVSEVLPPPAARHGQHRYLANQHMSATASGAMATPTTATSTATAMTSRQTITNTNSSIAASLSLLSGVRALVSRCRMQDIWWESKFFPLAGVRHLLQALMFASESVSGALEGHHASASSLAQASSSATEALSAWAHSRDHPENSDDERRDDGNDRDENADGGDLDDMESRHRRHAQGVVVSRASASLLENLIAEIAVRNRDRCEELFPILYDHYRVTMGPGTSYVSHLLERRVCGLMRVVSRLVSSRHRDENWGRARKLVGLVTDLVDRIHGQRSLMPAIGVATWRLVQENLAHFVDQPDAEGRAVRARESLERDLMYLLAQVPARCLPVARRRRRRVSLCNLAALDAAASPAFADSASQAGAETYDTPPVIASVRAEPEAVGAEEEAGAEDRQGDEEADGKQAEHLTDEEGKEDEDEVEDEDEEGDEKDDALNPVVVSTNAFVFASLKAWEALLLLADTTAGERNTHSLHWFTDMVQALEKCLLRRHLPAAASLSIVHLIVELQSEAFKVFQARQQSARNKASGAGPEADTTVVVSVSAATDEEGEDGGNGIGLDTVRARDPFWGGAWMSSVFALSRASLDPRGNVRSKALQLLLALLRSPRTRMAPLRYRSAALTDALLPVARVLLDHAPSGAAAARCLSVACAILPEIASDHTQPEHSHTSALPDDEGADFVQLWREVIPCLQSVRLVSNRTARDLLLPSVQQLAPHLLQHGLISQDGPSASHAAPTLTPAQTPGSTSTLRRRTSEVLQRFAAATQANKERPEKGREANAAAGAAAAAAASNVETAATAAAENQEETDAELSTSNSSGYTNGRSKAAGEPGLGMVSGRGPVPGVVVGSPAAAH